MNDITHIFFDVHMGWGHVGLGELLKMQTKKTLPSEGETAVFINKAWTGVKLLTHTGVILYVRREKEGINPETIRYLPACVEGKELNYKKALEIVIKKRFENPRGR